MDCGPYASLTQSECQNFKKIKSLFQSIVGATPADLQSLHGQEKFPIATLQGLRTLTLAEYAQAMGGGGGGLPSHSIADHNNVTGNPQNGDVLTYSNGNWQPVAISSGWSLSGNSLTDYDFIGSNNGKAVYFKINSERIGFIDEKGIIFGKNAAPGVNSTARPYLSLISLGENSSYSASNYSSHIAIGDNTLYKAGIMQAVDIIVGGFYAILTVGTTDYTTVGAADNNIGTYFTATGIPTGNGTVHALNTNGNIAIGGNSLYGLIEGWHNVSIGTLAGNLLREGNKNIFIGTQAGNNTTEGNNNIFIGEYNTYPLGVGNHGIVIGNNVSAQDSVTIIGNFNQTIQTHLEGTLTLGTMTKDSSALLQMNSTTQGFLPPRMTGAQAEAIASPSEGLMIYSTDGSGTTILSKGWWGYDGTNWVKLN